MPVVKGVRLSTAATAIRYKDRDDLLLVEVAEGSAVAGVFTRSSTAAAPVIWCREALASGEAPRALVVNAGNANAFTGKRGFDAVYATVDALAGELGIAKGAIYVSSTGVIGQPLAVEKIVSHFPALHASLGGERWSQAGDAIRTTDTFIKLSPRKVLIGDTLVAINGFAKGSGMIAPNMATMLAYVFTDAAVEPATLQEILEITNEASFNSITVDGDSSTNDTLLAFATGKAGNRPIASLSDPAATAFVTAFQEVLVDLALQVVRDGEGATKLVQVRVQGGESDASAKRIAMAIANSPLVKTAIAGEDPNWGRIVMAVGKTDEPVDVLALEIRIGGHLIAQHGGLIDGYDETPVAAYMKGQEIEIFVGVGAGAGSARVWTCDFTHDYISINAHYRS